MAVRDLDKCYGREKEKLDGGKSWAPARDFLVRCFGFAGEQAGESVAYQSARCRLRCAQLCEESAGP